MNKKFADNPKKDKFIKDCNEMAKSILGDKYSEDTTVKTAERIWKDYADEDYDAKCSIFRNGLKDFSKKFDMVLPKFNTVKEAVEYLVNNYTDDKTDYEVNFCEVKLNGKTYKLQIDKVDNDFIIITGFDYTDLPPVRYNFKDYNMDKNPNELYKEIEEDLINPSFNEVKVTTVKNNRSFSILRDNETYYGQLIGTLLQSAVIAHLYHFQTTCRWCHADVEDYYENIVDLLDELCEGILEPLDMDLIFSNVIDQKATPVDYFEELKAFCQDMKLQLFSLPEDSNYASIMDDIINLISKTLYRLKRFQYYKGESEQLTEGAINFSKRTFSEANGVKPAPQLFAVIFISKDHKLDCNASYKEADQDAVDCFVPEGGYGVLDGKKYLDDLELNRKVPKCDCEAKIVPASKVKIRGRIGHSSASL